MASRLCYYVIGALLLGVVTACSSGRSTVAAPSCERVPPAATLVFPQPGVRNVSTAVSEIVLAGGSDDRLTKVSLIDSGGREIDIGPLHAIPRPADAPSGVTYRAAAIATVTATMNYIVLYHPIGCAGATDYAIGSFTTQ